jgi:hypothetical protein
MGSSGFFHRLHEKVLAFEEHAPPHPRARAQSDQRSYDGTWVNAGASANSGASFFGCAGNVSRRRFNLDAVPVSARCRARAAPAQCRRVGRAHAAGEDRDAEYLCSSIASNELSENRYALRESLVGAIAA